MEEPAAEIEFSYLGENHLFEVYDNGQIIYSQNSEEQFREDSLHFESWIKAWSDPVGHGSPYVGDVNEKLEIRVSPEYHKGDEWASSSWDSFSVSTQKQYHENYSPLEAVREMIEELDHRPKALHQMTEGRELETLVNTVLDVETAS